MSNITKMYIYLFTVSICFLVIIGLAVISIDLFTIVFIVLGSFKIVDIMWDLGNKLFGETDET